ncbi:hypothetical protein [Methanocella sp. MCL-LM]|uniref:hypothetical protein n=1 Tax=Methanocella sp. MCL-LM TaxID=3412035 RepID=UPI003C76B104
MRKDRRGDMGIAVGIIAFIVLLAVGTSIADTALQSSTVNETSELYPVIDGAGENMSNVVDMTWMYYLGAAGFAVLALFMKLR